MLSRLCCDLSVSCACRGPVAIWLKLTWELLQLPKRNTVAPTEFEGGCFGKSADLSLVVESLAICAEAGYAGLLVYVVYVDTVLCVRACVYVCVCVCGVGVDVCVFQDFVVEEPTGMAKAAAAVAMS